MRQISAQAEPLEFRKWRETYRTDINFGYALITSELREQIKASLIEEQRGLCAYTGLGIDINKSHIEHLIPQDHCTPGEGDVSYSNMVACVPAPGTPRIPFGALPKANWPSPEQQHLFVSPRSAHCEERFRFNLRGEISAEANDEAARETIDRLKLDHKRLERLRKEAIDATLRWYGKRPPLLDLRAAQKRLANLETAEMTNGRLEPFCFALKQALRKHITRLESIRESKRPRRR